MYTLLAVFTVIFTFPKEGLRVRLELNVYSDSASVSWVKTIGSYAADSLVQGSFCFVAFVLRTPPLDLLLQLQGSCFGRLLEVPDVGIDIYLKEGAPS